MKILVVQDWLRNGGTERQSVLLSNAFAAAGHECSLLTFRPGGRLADTVNAKVRRQSLQPFDLGLDWFAPRLPRVVESFRPEIVLCMGRMANCYAGALQERLKASAVIATMRTGKPLPWLFRRSLRRVRHVIANSHAARNALVANLGLEPARITVIHNSLVFSAAGSRHSPAAAHDIAVGPHVASMARTTLRAAHGATAATQVLLCVAMLRPEKNQRELIEIVAGLPSGQDTQLWLAGDGPARRECERLVAERHAEGRVRFLGFHRNPSSLYAAADVAVHASRSESLSNFLIEAQVHGLPAIAYQAQGIDECFVPERTGWVIAPGDRAAFRERIVTLAQEPADCRQARSIEAATFARTTFDADAQVRRYLDLFGHLTSP